MSIDQGSVGRVGAAVRGLALLRPYLARRRGMATLVVLAAIAGAALEGLGVGLLVPLLSLMFGGAQGAPGRFVVLLERWIPGRPLPFYVATLSIGIVTAIFLKNALLLSGSMIGARLKRDVIVGLRRDLFAKLQTAELSVFEQRRPGEIASVFLREVGRTMETLDGLQFLAERVAVAAFYLLLLGLISPPLTVIALLLGAGIGVAVRAFHQRLRRTGTEITGLYQQFTGRVLESAAGARVVRAVHGEQQEIARFSEINEAIGRSHERAVRMGATLAPFTETLAASGAMVILWVAFLFMLRGGTLPPSYLVGFSLVLLRLLPVLNQIHGVHGNLLLSSEGMREVARWLALPSYPPQPFGTQPLHRTRHAIRFENVSYRYPNGTLAVHDVGFELPVGRTVALVGASGSGKSTIASLLLRLRLPTAGRITVDGQDYRTFAASGWHRAVAAVEQEAFLFNDTLRANIAFGCDEPSDDAIADALRIAQLDDVVRRLPSGLETVVGDRGMSLSGGQRQRVAIARAIVRDPSILLLDEATSSLDTIAERKVHAALERARRGRTVLVIAHRLATIREADHIVVLEQGRIVEEGSWDELASRNGAFARLLRSAEFRHGDALPASAEPTRIGRPQPAAS